VRRVAVIVSLCAGLLVAAAIAGAIVRDDPGQLTQEEFVVMARSVGLYGDVGPQCIPVTDDAEERLKLLYEDCAVSERMATLRRLLSACEDPGCARETASQLIGVADRAEQIERLFASDLSGDCSTFFEVEADYDHGIAEAADPLLTVPDGLWFDDGIGRWQRDSIATANAIDRKPVPELLSACRP
jgi:hypothetical protein